MRKFELGQRVLVSVRDLDGALRGLLAHGTVARLRRADALAWVCLDKQIDSLPTDPCRMPPGVDPTAQHTRRLPPPPSQEELVQQWRQDRLGREADATPAA